MPVMMNASSPKRRILLPLFLFLCVAAAHPGAGRDFVEARPEEVGISSQRLARLGQELQAQIDRGELAGVVTLVARRGRIVQFEARGIYDGGVNGEPGKPMRRDNIFGVASMTKPMMSAGVMVLYEEGRFLLDDPISKFIPAFKNPRVYDPKAKRPKNGGLPTVPAAREITIRDLLTHTSGLTHPFVDQGPLGELYKKADFFGKGTNLEQMVDRLAKLPLKFQPGTTWEYSLSPEVLGYFVEVVSGQPLDRFLEERVFKPLKMVDTGFSVSPEQIPRLTSVYFYDKGKLRILAKGSNRSYIRPPELLDGGGGLVSSVMDYARFLQMILNGGELDGRRLLSRKTVELMTIDHVPNAVMPPHLAGNGYGLGFAVRRNLVDLPRPGSPGELEWGGVFNTFFWVDPKEQLVGVIMAQMVPFQYLDLNHRFKVLVYQAIDD
jgi:CubicO group peptidase (beta-lactamase class C family)